jgi:hypothetical protein
MENASLPLTHPRAPGWPFWLGWVAASTAAVLLTFGAIYAAIFIAKPVLPELNEDRVFGGLIFPLMGALLGAAQWLVLRRWVARAGWWVLATAAGLPVGIAFSSGIIQLIGAITGRKWDWDFLPGMLVFYGGIGLCLTLAQGAVLWRQIQGRALWLAAGLLGWLVLGLLVGKSIDRMADILAVGPVPAVFTGLALLRLLRRVWLGPAVEFPVYHP